MDISRLDSRGRTIAKVRVLETSQSIYIELAAPNCASSGGWTLSRQTQRVNQRTEPRGPHSSTFSAGFDWPCLMLWPCGASARSQTHTAALALLVQLIVASSHLTADEGFQCEANGLERSDLSENCSQNMYNNNHLAVSIQISHHGV